MTLIRTCALATVLVGCLEAPMIEDAFVTCDDKNLVTFTIETIGESPVAASVFSQETGNAEPNYADEFEFDTTGVLSDLELTLETDADSPGADRTIFTCPRHHGNPEGVMTYAYRVYDSLGGLADCVIQGDDPDALQNDLLDRVNDPSDADELIDCDLRPGVY